ncbi:MAG: D-ribose pyranase [Bacillus sp. (in: firmicutes)]
MKKHGILNSSISKVLSDLGHTDMIVVADAGLPIPKGVPKIDLALVPGKPSFQETVSAIVDDMVIEKVILANEIQSANVKTNDYMKQVLGNVPFEYISHEDLKALSKEVKVIIRTGEITPYANVVLQAGVFF